MRVHAFRLQSMGGKAYECPGVWYLLVCTFVTCIETERRGRRPRVPAEEVVRDFKCLRVFVCLCLMYSYLLISLSSCWIAPAVWWLSVSLSCLRI